MIRALAKHRNSYWAKVIWIGWTWVLPVIILIAIFLKFGSGHEGIAMWEAVRVEHGLGLVLCLMLLPLNIGFEAFKWKYILKPIEQKSLVHCIKIILAGKSLNVVSPFGIGDGFSRYINMGRSNRKQIFSGLAIDRATQLLPTLFFGFASVYFLIENGFELSLRSLLFSAGVMAIACVGLGVIFFFYFEKIKSYLRLLRELDWSLIATITGVSFARYVIFVLQFYLIFWALGCQLPVFIIVMGVAWIFLIKTLIPNLSIPGDLVKRELSATLFFSFFTPDLSLVIVASFLVWVINIVSPAVIGLFFVSNFKKSF